MNSTLAAEVKEAIVKTTLFQRYVMSRWGKKLHIGEEQRAGWSGKLPFYLFFCSDCGHYAKDYPHGHIERQYLLCSHCGVHHSFVPLWPRLAGPCRSLCLALRYRFTGR